MKDWIYDIECYPNCFVCILKNTTTNEKKIFQISPLADQRNEMVIFIRDEVGMMIGFNNLFYDCPMLHYFITKVYPKKYRGLETCWLMKTHSNELIKNNAKPWNNYVRNPFRSQMDLFKIHHFDNNAKRTGLKELMFVFRMKDIEELPYPPDKMLTVEEIKHLIEYCDKDVEATHIFFQKSQDAVMFRKRMSAIYNIDFTNTNDVKIGELILVKSISEKWGMPYDEILKMRTVRGEMNINSIIFSYVQFRSGILNNFLRWWKLKTITETKGQFSEIALDEVEGIWEYTDKLLKKGTLKKLNIIYKGFKFDMGTGGIHAYQHAKKTGIWVADDEYNIDLVDVSSYYPNLADKNYLAPAHFPVEIFRSVIQMLYQQRMEGAKIGDKQIVKAIKLALNGALYGKSNSQFSSMYDPLFMMTICVNGQLLLMMIAEEALDLGFEVIQSNTDSVTIRYPKTRKPEMDNIVKEWERTTGLKLSYESYSKFIQRDTNNYLGIQTNGKIKRKGVFLIDREFHQNHGQLVVAKAIEEFYTKDTKPEIFINNHLNKDKNLYDFFKLVKIQRNHELVERMDYVNTLIYPTKTKRMKKWKITCIESERELQNTTRYYVAKQGFKLIKKMPPLEDKIGDRETEIEAGNRCIECNNLNLLEPDQVRGNLNIDYYVNEAYKIINSIEQGIELELEEGE